MCVKQMLCHVSVFVVVCHACIAVVHGSVMTKDALRDGSDLVVEAEVLSIAKIGSSDTDEWIARLWIHNSEKGTAPSNPMSYRFSRPKRGGSDLNGTVYAGQRLRMCLDCTDDDQFAVWSPQSISVLQGVPKMQRVLPSRPGETVYGDGGSLIALVVNMSHKMAKSLTPDQMHKIGVVEFTTDSKHGDVLGGPIGMLGQACATQLQCNLSEIEGLDTIDNRKLIQALQANSITVNGLHSVNKLGRLTGAMDGLTEIVCGRIRYLGEGTVSLECRQFDLQQKKMLAIERGIARLNPTEWAMLGQSAWVKPEERPRSFVESGENHKLIELMDERAKGPHPLQDPSFPYRVEVLVNRQRRSGEFHGNDYTVHLKKGETFSVLVRTPGRVQQCLCLFVDGRNTLPFNSAIGAIAESEAPLVRLGEPNAWSLRVRDVRPRNFLISGFYDRPQVGAKVTPPPFRTGGSVQSIPRKRFNQNTGMISAIFYQPKPERTGIGGPPRPYRIGDILGAVHVRYTVTEDGQTAR